MARSVIGCSVPRSWRTFERRAAERSSCTIPQREHHACNTASRLNSELSPPLESFYSSLPSSAGQTLATPTAEFRRGIEMPMMFPTPGHRSHALHQSNPAPDSNPIRMRKQVRPTIALSIKGALSPYFPTIRNESATIRNTRNPSPRKIKTPIHPHHRIQASCCLQKIPRRNGRRQNGQTFR